MKAVRSDPCRTWPTPTHRSSAPILIFTESTVHRFQKTVRTDSGNQRLTSASRLPGKRVGRNWEVVGMRGRGGMLFRTPWSSIGCMMLERKRRKGLADGVAPFPSLTPPPPSGPSMAAPQRTLSRVASLCICHALACAARKARRCARSEPPSQVGSPLSALRRRAGRVGAQCPPVRPLRRPPASQPKQVPRACHENTRQRLPVAVKVSAFLRREGSKDAV